MQIVLNIFCMFGLAFTKRNTVFFRRGLEDTKNLTGLGISYVDISVSKLQCCVQCRQDSVCKSVIYDENSMKCGLCSTTNTNDQVPSSSSSSIYYYELENVVIKDPDADSLQLPYDCNFPSWLPEFNLTGWNHFRCTFYLLVPHPMALNMAVKYCRDLDYGEVQLVVPESPEENDFVRRMTFENQQELEAIFLGLAFDKESKLRSVTGAGTMGYTNWDPTFKRTTGQCVTMARNGKWKLQPTSKERPFVCKLYWE